MNSATLSCVCLSDFNLSNFNAYLSDPAEAPALRVISTDYGQVIPLLLDANAPCWREKPDSALVWTRPEAVSPAFGRLMQHEPVTPDALCADVDEFADLLSRLAGRVGCVLVPAWTLPGSHRGFGLLDMNPQVGIRAGLMRMNQRLCERLSGETSMYVLDADRWLARSRRPGFNAKLWYMAKIAFDNEILKLAAAEVKAAIRSIRGQNRKLLVIDLDNTLWGGVVGDAGMENLVLGGHDPQGEAFADFQRNLKALSNRGILLAIASKNDEAVALNAIQHHPEMILRKNDFAGWRINWGDKAQNIADLAAELNLGLQSVVFLDDNPVERDRIRQALPEVLVPEMPEDILLCPAFLAELTCFDTPSFTGEDRERTAAYTTDRMRRAERQQVASVDDWLRGLQMTVTIESLAPSNLSRAAQLLNKTNQMNLATRRLTESELMEWSRGDGRRCWTIRVDDKFGSSGLTGILSVERAGEDLMIVDFVLSCRVMGRKVEETMLSAAVGHARSQDLTSVRAVYLPTPRNNPCLEFFRRSGFVGSPETSEFRWNAENEYPFPPQLTVKLPAPDIVAA